MKLPPLNYKYFREDYAEMLENIRTSKENTHVLKDRWGVSRSTILKIRKDAQNPEKLQTQNLRVEQYKQHAQLVQDILNTPGSIKELCEKFSVHPNTVSSIRRRNKKAKRMNMSFFDGRTYRAFETPLPPLPGTLTVRERLRRTISEFFE